MIHADDGILLKIQRNKNQLDSLVGDNSANRNRAFSKQLVIVIRVNINSNSNSQRSTHKQLVIVLRVNINS